MTDSFPSNLSFDETTTSSSEVISVLKKTFPEELVVFSLVFPLHKFLGSFPYKTRTMCLQ